MKFCSNCGETVSSQIPPGDNRQRFVCDSCGEIHYQNPKNVAGAILTWQNKILMCKRAIEPCYGLWTLPAGFMENNESVHQAAARESIEEANAKPGHLTMFGIFSLPYISQVYLMFSGELLSEQVSPGLESLEVELMTREQIPWEEIAFPVVRYSLELFYKLGANSGVVHQARFNRLPNRELEVLTEL
ncbi:MAG: NUDIX hydrolase [Gammaproteobacteria bacterium]|nr:NUDIX hydrolase [Gammaproteobacteria bacterium]